jgi:hypothetical protein
LGLVLATSAGAQQKSPNVAQGNLGYDVSREVSVQGSVVSYSETSSVAPFGPHVSLKTSSSVLDVHLGNARLLELNHVSLAAGDQIRIVGENVAYGTGTQFLARIIQKGNQAVALRTPRGFPLAPVGKLGPHAEAGAL